MWHRIHRTLLAMLLLVVVACPRGQSTTDAALDTTALDTEPTVDATAEEHVDAVPDLDRPEEMAETATPDDAPLVDARADDTADAIDATVSDGGTTSDIVLCIPGRMEACRCADGRMGARGCSLLGMPEACECRGVIDAGWTVEAVATRTLPPRLIAPQSTMRVTSQRPTLRWIPPESASRVRVELCEDRACTRVLASAEVTAASWRPTTALRAGPVFWRVRALDSDGGVAWASVTWEFFVGRRDASADSSYGVPRDFDGDGYDDIMMYNLTGILSLVVRYGAPAFAFSRSTILRPTSAEGRELLNTNYTIGDFNGDGRSDLATSVDFPSAVSAYYGTPTGLSMDSFSTNINVGDNDMLVRGGDACDFNGDGFSDLLGISTTAVTSSAPYGTWTVMYPGSDTGIRHSPRWIAANTILPGSSQRSARCAGDVNADGYADLFLNITSEAGNTGRSFLFFGGPDGLDNPAFIRIDPPLELRHFATDPSGGVGDTDGDGYADLQIAGGLAIGFYLGGPRLRIDLPNQVVDLSPMTMTDGGLLSSSVIRPEVPTFGDFNGDGFADSIDFVDVSAPRNSRDSLGPPVFYRLFGGLRERGVQVSGAVDTPNPGRPPAPYVGDFNGDGFDDLILNYHESVAHLLSGSRSGLNLTAIDIARP